MKKQPKLKIQWTPFDFIIELTGWFFMLVMWAVVLFIFKQLPETIPVHFDGSGTPDAFGPKRTIYMLPVIATALFLGLTIINFFPHTFNYPIVVTAENAEQQYINATRMVRYIKTIIVLVFGWIVWMTYLAANQEVRGLGIWFLPIIVALILAPIALYLIQSLRK